MEICIFFRMNYAIKTRCSSVFLGVSVSTRLLDRRQISIFRSQSKRSEICFDNNIYSYLSRSRRKTCHHWIPSTCITTSHEREDFIWSRIGYKRLADLWVMFFIFCSENWLNLQIGFRSVQSERVYLRAWWTQLFSYSHFIRGFCLGFV